MSPQPIGEYRGCILLLYPPTPVRKEPLYGNSCTAGLRYTIDRVKQDIDAYRGEAPEPPPPVEEDHIEETYRGVDIWWQVAHERFWAQVATGYTAVAATLTEMRASIDEILEFLNPPEEPEEGLFAQVVAAVKAWVLVNVPDWLLEWGQVVNNWITNVTEAITNVYNYVTENITNVINNVYDYVTNVYNTTREYITNSYTYVTESITNNFSEVHNHITNIIGVSEESVNEKIVGVTSWVNGLFALLDPHAFLEDPLGFIRGAFNTFIEPWAEGLVKAFWEGFEEGLEE